MKALEWQVCVSWVSGLWLRGAELGWTKSRAGLAVMSLVPAWRPEYEHKFGHLRECFPSCTQCAFPRRRFLGTAQDDGCCCCCGSGWAMLPGSFSFLPHFPEAPIPSSCTLSSLVSLVLLAMVAIIFLVWLVHSLFQYPQVVRDGVEKETCLCMEVCARCQEQQRIWLL